MPPKTLTRQEFMAHPVGQRPGAKYENYLRFVARKRAQRQAPQDPLAPSSAQQIRQRVSQAVGAQTDPLIAQINRQATQRAGQVDTSTRARMSRLEGVRPVVAGAFGKAQQATAGVGDVLAERLNASGQKQGRGLRDALASLEAPRLTEEVAGGVEDLGRGAANAEFAVQSGVLRDLLARGAEAEGFAGMLPGFAEAEGAAFRRGILSEADRDVADIRSKIPGLSADLVGEERNRELQKGIARLGFQESQEDLAFRERESAADRQAAILSDLQGEQSGRAKAASEKRAGAVKARGDAVASARKTASSLARTLYKGEKVTENIGGRLVGKKETTVKRPTYAQAYRQLWAEIADELRDRYAMKPQAIREIVQGALKAAGFQAQEAKAKPGAAYPRYPGG